MSVVLTLYGRDGCHLCDQARRTIQALAAEADFELRELDIDGDERLQREYFDRIPVLELDGRELFEHFVFEDELRRALESRR